MFGIVWPYRVRKVSWMKKLALVLASGGLLFLSGCAQIDSAEVRRLGLPEPAGDRTEEVFNLWVGAWIASLAVMVLVFGLLFYAMVKYRRRSDDEVPSQIRYHLPLEALYTIAPIIIVTVFFFHTVTAQNSILDRVENPDHVIEVVGSKWQWTFNYLDESATGGEDVFDQGTIEDLPDLYLPVNESVRFNLKSPDVIHSFWIPEFYFKMDVIPGRDNSFDVTPTREGVFVGRCAELCGIYHSRMLFDVHVVSAAEYEAHLKELQAAGQVGAPAGLEFADKVSGLGEREN